jgi:hypothetical protein|uniref:Uncharacterized protein n=1 Tax=Siphoviridae sp. ctVFN1 TaxID=2827575 RepID=A0A8S5LLK7_9CAUD|nr:MAG TPA: hypothetical protein [Siphoviridae sp. ctVFN1]
MAFRNCSFNPSFPRSCKVIEDVVKTNVVDGVEVETVVQVDALEIAETFPDVDDYKLSALMATGQPLSAVDPVIFNNPYSDAENILNSSLSAQEPVQEPVQEPAQEPTNV